MSEITISLEYPNLGCGEIIARYDLSEIQEKAYQQGREDVCNKLTDLCTRWVDDDGTCWNTDCPFCDDVCKIEQLKSQDSMK